MLGAGRSAGASTGVGTGAPITLLAQQLTQGGWARGQADAVLALDLDGTPVTKDERGGFFIAFDRNAPPSAVLTGRGPNGRETALPLTIAPRAWQIEHIDAPMRPPKMPSGEFWRLRAAELARIAAARAKVTGADGWSQAMLRPVEGRISGRFGSQRVYRGEPGSYHSGLDIAARTGTPILAPADGVVILAAASPFTLEGRLLMLDHGMGLSAAFLHCSAHRVAEGDVVRRGQAIAEVGMTGRATGPHLHWGLKWREARLDPLLFLLPA
ncbi:MAG: M23 family metallopeptidase [Sphingomonadales bacterium]|nr:M23 family metallopeptidase [Sphingomonadales bacterium]MBU3993240.1 M23 family metallopeptidase [Alphaproteobacteria bacterium]